MRVCTRRFTVLLFKYSSTVSAFTPMYNVVLHVAIIHSPGYILHFYNKLAGATVFPGDLSGMALGPIVLFRGETRIEKNREVQFS